MQDLIEAILATIRDIHKFNNLGLEIAIVGLGLRFDQSETCNLLSNMSDWLSSVLKSADPARMSPEQFGLSLEMNSCTATSATWARIIDETESINVLSDKYILQFKQIYFKF